ncbi:MAG: 4-(cytidine 5'-diphospho)-2-C-methyl-D-erythritol kinase [Rhodobacter sp.]|nr:4-(cytidine 5'-diphospho)-2-C-methyl-D-erythritol kinase [Paracoccaceae bacterium]MCC0080493.1 4-(cytidine 5'-diphospho)-2-C-methyl-D-erythritol kinase [Rhodobacter sp.]
MPATSRLAPAKINLTLHVTGQRADGYHLLDSLVVFTEAGDRVALDGGGPGLRLSGPQAAALDGEGDNLVLRAARLIGAGDAGLALDKRLPVASGMGGGSSDAAAALHLLAETRDLSLPDTAALMTLGADLPVCMAAPAPSRMRGLGEQVAPVGGVPALWLVLVNPGQGLSTPAVFKALSHKQNPPMPVELPRWPDPAALCDWLAGQRNDLQAPAQALVPAVGQVLAGLSAQPGCLLARMTGSGATCFGIFRDQPTATAAETALARPGWFTAVTRSSASVS